MVIRFPTTVRAGRERTLDVATKVIPLLEVALEGGNARLLRELFAVLGDVAHGGDASGRLEAISIEDADVAHMQTARRL